MKIIVTGGTGFIAKNLIEVLIAQNHEVHAIIRKHSDTSGIAEGTSFFIDNGNSAALVDFFNNIKADGVIHLASLFLANHTQEDTEALITSNILFGTRLLEASVKANTKWFINTGTFWQHYDNKDYNPVNLYAATKQAFQDIAKFYYETEKINFVTIKLNDTFGADDTRKKIFNLWESLTHSGESLGMSSGEQIIDISYIEDIVDAYVLMIEHLNNDSDFSYAGKVYSISSSQRMSLKALSKIYEKSADKVLNITWGERPYRDREVMFPWDKGESVPGWKQKTSLEEAIKKIRKG